MNTRRASFALRQRVDKPVAELDIGPSVHPDRRKKLIWRQHLFNRAKGTTVGGLRRTARPAMIETRPNTKIGSAFEFAKQFCYSFTCTFQSISTSFDRVVFEFLGSSEKLAVPIDKQAHRTKSIAYQHRPHTKLEHSFDHETESLASIFLEPMFNLSHARSTLSLRCAERERRLPHPLAIPPPRRKASPTKTARATPVCPALPIGLRSSFPRRAQQGTASL